MSQQPAWSLPVDYAVPLKMNTRRAIKFLLYLAGVSITAFGITGVIIVANHTLFGGYIGICSGLGSFLIGIIIFFRTRQYLQGLSWGQYVLWIFGLTIVACIAFLLVVFLFQSTKANLANILFYSIFLLYGATLVLLAYKKPPLLQQVDESVQCILEIAPNKQVSITDLITYLQRTYQLSEPLLHQYINDLKSTEQFDIPNSNTRMICIKGTAPKNVIAFPQVQGIVTDHLRESIFRALRYLNVEEVDIGLFELSREFENALKDYLLAANAKGKLSVPILPKHLSSPGSWRLVDKIDLARDNRIITDKAVLSFLREERNKRAHGGMPPFAERCVLMNNIQYLAGLYIDYIKWFDDLTHSL